VANAKDRTILVAISYAGATDLIGVLSQAEAEHAGDDHLNTMIMQAEARRNTALREIERHRDLLAARLREAAAIEDAEFEEVEGATSGQTDREDAANATAGVITGGRGDG
jgi:hypothetical protein